MYTIDIHLDDLDRMVDSGCAPKHEVRGQIALIRREVAALEADYLGLLQAHSDLQKAHTELQGAQTKRSPEDDMGFLAF